MIDYLGMSEDTSYEDNKVGIAVIDIPLWWSEKILESRRLANIFIALCVAIIAAIFFGIAVFATNLFAPVDAAQVPVEDIRAAGR